MFKARIKPPTPAVVLAGFGPVMLSAPFCAVVIQEQVSIKPEKTISPQEETVISSAAAKMPHHIAQARILASPY